MCAGSHVFSLEHVSYSYTKHLQALSDVSFDVESGEAVALLGANGSGKSTLLRLMNALIYPTEGKVSAFGTIIDKEKMRDPSFVYEFRSKVGLVFQDSDVQLFSATVWDEVLFGPLQMGLTEHEVVARGMEALRLLRIEHLKERAPYNLSGGEKKKAAIASVLSLHPQVLLMDEPSSGLDPFSQGNLIDFLMEWVKKENCLIFSTQDLDMVEELATRVIVLSPDHTVVADGKPEQFLYDPGFLLRANLVHQHSHRHKNLVHSHPHNHIHNHSHDNKTNGDNKTQN